jgi:cytochrome c-type biogenesis protein
MALAHFGLLAAFVAGLLSFLSPCVFPLVPGYLSYLAGTTLRQGQGTSPMRWQVSLHALCFVLGFALIFAALGAAASVLGVLLTPYRQLLAYVAGVLLIIFGIVLTGLLPLPFLSGEYRVHVVSGTPALLRSGLVGVAFGAGWSPCMGPILGSILALAAVSTTLAQGIVFLLIYALGLGVPFLLVGLLIDRAAPVVRRINRYTGPIAIIGGVILVLTGMLILSGRLAELANFAPLFNF